MFIIDLHSYGHDIETAWLLDRGVDVLGDETYKKKIRPISEALEDRIYEIAYRNHSLANECENGIVNEKRIWWVQAEAVVGFFNAWEKRKTETKFLVAAKNIWIFIKEHMTDHRPGSEWFWYTDAEGNPGWEEPIVEPWKCPYHNGRMCMELIRRSKE